MITFYFTHQSLKHRESTDVFAARLIGGLFADSAFIVAAINVLDHFIGIF